MQFGWVGGRVGKVREVSVIWMERRRRIVMGITFLSMSPEP